MPIHRYIDIDRQNKEAIKKMEKLQIQEKLRMYCQEFARDEEEDGRLTPHCLLEWKFDDNSMKWENTRIG